MSTSPLKADSRAAFEKFMESETGFDLYRTNFPMTNPEDQQYKDHTTNMAWLAWQASRAAIVVELPEYQEISDSGVAIPDEVDWPDGFNTAIEQCADTLRAAGITVKGDSDGK